MSDTAQGPGWWQATDGNWYAPELATLPVQAPEEPVLFSIGDVGITHSWVVTPSGTQPIKDVQFAATDMSVTTQKTPGWAIVLVIVFIWFFFLSLLFLFAKETRTEGAVMVTATGPRFMHTTTIPVWSHQEVIAIQTNVSHANAFAQAAKGALGGP